MLLKRLATTASLIRRAEKKNQIRSERAGKIGLATSIAGRGGSILD
jgi:hypothetical protein